MTSLFDRFRLPDPPSAPPAREVIQVSQPQLISDFVTRMVARSDAIPQVSRSGGSVSKDLTGYMHVSSLIGACEREHVISRLHGIPTHSTVSGSMKMIWAIGRAVEKHIRNGVIMARDWKGIYGKWRCRCRLTTWTGEHPEGRTCGRCGSGLDTYLEPLLINHDHGIIGSPDLTLVEQGYHLVSEIKSMNKEQFDALSAPLADHVVQGVMYRALYRDAGFPVHDIVPIIYGRKDFKFGGSRAVYKEYHVDAREWEGQVQSCYAIADRIKLANSSGVLPARVCSSSTCSRAKECERTTLCFSL